METLFIKSEEKEIGQKSYKLTLLKKISHSTKAFKIRERVDDFIFLKQLHSKINPILWEMNLNYEGIRYFAGTVIKSKIFQLTQRSEKDRYIHAIAFVAHQYYRLQDNLVDVLLTALQSFQNTTKREYQELIYDQQRQHSKALSGFLSNLDADLFSILKQIRIIRPVAK